MGDWAGAQRRAVVALLLPTLADGRLPVLVVVADELGVQLHAERGPRLPPEADRGRGPSLGKQRRESSRVREPLSRFACAGVASLRRVTIASQDPAHQRGDCQPALPRGEGWVAAQLDHRRKRAAGSIASFSEAHETALCTGRGEHLRVGVRRRHGQQHGVVWADLQVGPRCGRRRRGDRPPALLQ